MLNQPESVRNVVKDFNLGWRGQVKNQALYVNVDHTEYGGLKIVEKTVFAMAWNQDFIIALQHPGNSTTDTLYHIIDIREYSQRFWGPSDNVYTLENDADYQQKKQELGVGDMEIKPVLMEGDLDG
jgi:hypothetical protein